MKKWTSLLVAALLTLTLAAGCGKTPVTSTVVPDDTIVTTTTGTDATTTTEQADVTTTTTTAAATKKPTTAKKPTTTAKNSTPATTTAAPVTMPTTQPKAKTKVRITTIAGPTGVGMVNLMAGQDAGTAANDYTFDLVNDPTKAVSAISGGSTDIAAVPTNLASTLYNKTGGKVTILAVNTLGVLHIMENGNTINSVADLRGKEIYTSGQGANPEYVLRYVLEKNGLDPDKDVTIHFVADNTALTAAVVTGQAVVAMVPEPVATSCRVQAKAKGLTVRMVLDMTAEWDKVSNGSSQLMMGCVIARRAFVEENPEAVKLFLAEYEASIATVKADVDAAAALCEKYTVIPKAAIAKQAIPNCNLTFVAGSAMKERLSGYLQVLYGYNPQAVGGKLPAGDFYYGA